MKKHLDKTDKGVYICGITGKLATSILSPRRDVLKRVVMYRWGCEVDGGLEGLKEAIDERAACPSENKCGVSGIHCYPIKITIQKIARIPTK